MGGVEFFRPAVVFNLENGHQVEAQKEEVDQVVFGQVFAGQVGVDAAQASQASPGSPDA